MTSTCRPCGSEGQDDKVRGGAGPVGQRSPDTSPPPSGLPRADLVRAVEAVVK